MSRIFNYLNSSHKGLSKIMRSLFDNLKDSNIEFFKKLKTPELNNYKLAIRYLEAGNLWDATFRFKLVSKVWSKNYMARYYYAYCLVLKDNVSTACNILNALLIDDPENEDAKLLLDKIDNNEQDKIKDKYFAKFAESKDKEDEE